jgi:glycosyltransferase involved in cell wall biosynthesis
MANDISLCMILKNEEDWVEKAISSVISLVDEVILVDTGSTDKTLDRAARFNPRIIKAEWTDHFGDARNISLEEANCSWILVLDADECISGTDIALMKKAVSGKADGFQLIQRNYVHQNQVHGWEANNSDYEEGRPYPGYVDNPLIRLFRNDPKLRFQGAVHEIIDPTRLPETLEFSNLPVVIHHFGKVRGEDRVKAKQRLYLKLGQQKLKDDPRNSKAYLDLGIQFQELGQHAESREYFLKSFDMGGGSGRSTLLCHGREEPERLPCRRETP